MSGGARPGEPEGTADGSSLLPTLRPLLHRLAHPSALLAWAPGGDGWDGAGLRLLLVRPSPLRQVSGSATHLLVHQLLSRHPGVFADLAFLPEQADLPLLLRAGLSPLFGLLSGRPARAFHVVAFSHSVLPELANLPFLLQRCGLLLPPEQRRADPRQPLLLLGGANAPFCWSLVADPPLLDAVFLGELEPASAALIEALRPLARGTAQAREDALAALARVPGCYVPALPAPVVPPRHALETPILPADGVPLLFGGAAEAAVVELSRGCPAWCSFCAEGWHSRPYRERPPAAVLAEALAWKRASGACDLELSAYSFNAHAALGQLLPALQERFGRVALMSQRLDWLAARADLLELELALGKRSFSLGVEGVSERMRRRFAKGIDQSELLAAFRRICDQPAREVKLFFLLSGEENERDLLEFDALCGELASLRAAGRGQPRVVLSCGLLTIYPGTPLDGLAPCLDRPRCDRLLAALRRSAEVAGLELRTPSTWEEHLFGNLLLAHPVELRPELLRLSGQGKLYGTRLDPAWGPALERAAARLYPPPLPGAAALPDGSGRACFRLAFPLDDGRHAALVERLRAASLADRPPPDHCRHPDPARRRCLACGACARAGDGSLRQATPSLLSAAARVRRAIEQQRQARTIWIEAELAAGFGRLEHAALAALAGRTVLAAAPELTERLIGVAAPLHDPAAAEGGPLAGCCGRVWLALRLQANAAGEEAPLPAGLLPAGGDGPLRLERLLPRTGPPLLGRAWLRFTPEHGLPVRPDERAIVATLAGLLERHRLRHVLRKERSPDGGCTCRFELPRRAGRPRWVEALTLILGERSLALELSSGAGFAAGELRRALEGALDAPVEARVLELAPAG